MKAYLNRPIVVLPPNSTASNHRNIRAWSDQDGHTALIRRYIRDCPDSLQKGLCLIGPSVCHAN
jgi:hypothetical protein